MTGLVGKREDTRGPWKVTKDRGDIIVRVADATGQPIASMWLNGDDPEATANLIVAAVNERDALRSALADTIRILEAVRYSAGLGKGQLARLEAARSALKAEGER